uniref:hypothetical protein n=1 Tax=Mycolicibacterium porcinum TaxID=39693 RepID=UPI00190E7DC2
RPQPLAVGAEINRFAAQVSALRPQMPQWLRGDDKAIVEKEAGGVSPARGAGEVGAAVAAESSS